MRTPKNLVLIVLSLLALVAGTVTALAAPGYHEINRFKIGGEGGWDYLTFDPSAGRVFISRGTHVIVVDGKSGKVIGDIADKPGVHGIALAPDLHRGFTSNGRNATVTIFDFDTLKPIGSATTEAGPDAIIYDLKTHSVLAMNWRGESVTVIDGATGKVQGSIPLGGKPEFAAADGKGKVFINIEDKSEQVEIDPAALKITRRWPLAPCEEPSGLAIDRAHRRLFAGCHNKMMAVVDIDAGKVVATPAIGQGVDANAFDPGLQLAFSSNGDGTLTVVHEDSPDKYTIVENATTLPRARTMTLDEKTHNVYLVTAEFGPAPAATAENPRPRPTMVPDSFVLLVLGR
jgi:YVTN family beta-propeller protein